MLLSNVHPSVIVMINNWGPKERIAVGTQTCIAHLHIMIALQLPRYYFERQFLFLLLFDGVLSLHMEC